MILNFEPEIAAKDLEQICLYNKSLLRTFLMGNFVDCDVSPRYKNVKPISYPAGFVNNDDLVLSTFVQEFDSIEKMLDFENQVFLRLIYSEENYKREINKEFLSLAFFNSAFMQLESQDLLAHRILIHRSQKEIFKEKTNGCDWFCESCPQKINSYTSRIGHLWTADVLETDLISPDTVIVMPDADYTGIYFNRKLELTANQKIRLEGAASIVFPEQIVVYRNQT